MDIAELLAETELLKKKSIETAQKLAEAKELLSRLSVAIKNNEYLQGFIADIEKVLR